METDWKLLREVLNTAIDSCEALDEFGYEENHRTRTVDVDGQQVSVYEFLVSAWTLPENVRYQVIRQRHVDGQDLRYVPETARIITAVASACAELIGGGKEPSGGDAMRGMMKWFRNHFDSNIARAIKG
jgi:hypothetical protein